MIKAVQPERRTVQVNVKAKGLCYFITKINGEEFQVCAATFRKVMEVSGARVRNLTSKSLLVQCRKKEEGTEE